MITPLAFLIPLSQAILLDFCNSRCTCITVMQLLKELLKAIGTGLLICVLIALFFFVLILIDLW